MATTVNSAHAEVPIHSVQSNEHIHKRQRKLHACKWVSLPTPFLMQPLTVKTAKTVARTVVSHG